MNNNVFYFVIVVMFNYFIFKVSAENDFYMITLRRNSSDGEYYKESETFQNQIDELVNDRMNDVYDIITDNKEIYVNEEGKPDKNLEEIERTFKLRKRYDNEISKPKKYKFKFINEIKSKKKKTNKSNKSKNRKTKTKIDNNEKNIEYITYHSNLVKHICPIKNYYIIVAYLSDIIIDKIKLLPNVINIKKTEIIAVPFKSLNNNLNEKRSNTLFYNKEDILDETQWSDLSVQEHKTDFDLRNTHLSLLSQGKYYTNSSAIYDNNYYFPSSAGKGIDIYIIDGGLDVSMSEDDFDEYKGTSDERTIKCEGEIYDGEFYLPSNEKYCKVKTNGNNKHGTIVGISAVGKINGVAKKSNLYMLATDYKDMDFLKAFEYIEQHADPQKTVINISRGCVENKKCYSQEIQDKIDELVSLGFIIFAPIGNTFKYYCYNQLFKNGVIHIGAINNRYFYEHYNMEKMYEKADYSSYGECVDLFAPGTIRLLNNRMVEVSGTSYASPVAAGVASTIMSENLNKTFNFESMRKELIELSLKDVIKGLNETTPNRLINNGKRSIYEPPRCDDASGEYHCQNKSCSKYGVCVDSDSKNSDVQKMCFIEEGCQSNYGKCYTNICGKNNNNKCIRNNCCSKDGKCININNDFNGLCLLENGCQSGFGGCYTKKCGKENNGRFCLVGECCSKFGNCIKVFNDFNGLCLIENGCQSEFGYCNTKKCGKENNGRICLEGECCSKDGNCINENYDFNGLCLLENGCQTKFGNCITERCDIPDNPKICSENQCCTKNGYCTDVSPYRNIIDDRCFVENGCKTGFSGQCFSKDINKIEEFPENYRQLLKNYLMKTN